MVPDGIDVYNGNGAIDWQVVAESGVKLGIAKATEGTYYKDARYRSNIEGMRAAGMMIGAYHFVRPYVNGTARDEAQYFLNYVDATTGIWPGMILALDFESYEGQWRLGAGTESIDYAATWLTYVDDAVGYAPFLYANLHMLANYLQWADTLSAYPLWFAGDRPDLAKFPVVLQQNGYADVPGAGQVDADYFGLAWKPITPTQQEYDMIYRASSDSTTNPAVTTGSLWVIVGQTSTGTLLIKAEEIAAKYPTIPIIDITGESLGLISVFTPSGGGGSGPTHGTWTAG